MSLNTTPRTWVAGEVVTAAEMNTEVRDAVTGVQAAWTTYTPTTTGITLTSSTLAGRWGRIGKTIDFTISLTFGASTAFTGPPTFTLPTTALSLGWAANIDVFDSSASAWYYGRADAGSTTVLTCRTWPGTAGINLPAMSATVPMTWATSDVLFISGRYEAA